MLAMNSNAMREGLLSQHTVIRDTALLVGPGSLSFGDAERALAMCVALAYSIGLLTCAAPQFSM
jgi:hypothetical protein